MKSWGVVILGVVGLLVSACAPNHSGNSTFQVSKNISGTGIQVFQQTFYAFAQSQNCVKCHGASTHPMFASSDLNTAYMEATGTQIGSTAPLIDFTNPSASIIATYAGNGHCGDTPCSNPANTAVVQG